MSKVDDNLVNLADKIKSLLPKELEIVKIEYEGPEVVVYAKNLLPVYEDPEMIRKVARAVRKKIVVKPDESARKPRKEAAELINKIVGEGGEIVELQFEPSTGEVIIITNKPGYVVGKGGHRLRKILTATGWKPVVMRNPPLKSNVISTIRAFYRENTKRRLEALLEIGNRIHRPLLFKTNYVRITALGAFKEVGRSAILLETKESKVLLDFGANVGSYDPQKHFPKVEEVPIDELDAVIVTHAHLDHCGLVPWLYKYGYRGPVYVTQPTRDLMYLVQKDYIEVARKEGKPVPYTESDINSMLLRTIALNYGEVTDVAPDIKLTFYNAGHILGSAMAHLHVGEGLFNLVYTGDFKYGYTRLLDKANTQFPRVEAVIMESTYGTQDLPPRELAERLLIDIINKTIEKGGFVLIPVLAVGRAQEILLLLVDAVQNKLIKSPEGGAVPIYLDGMVYEATAIHAAYPEWLAKSVKERIIKGENPFLADFVHKVESVSIEGGISREEVLESEPGVILATSGMLTGGPSLEYFRKLAPDPKNSIVFVAYQAAGTLGRTLKEGADRVEIAINEDGKSKLYQLEVRSHVFSVEGFSGHSSRSELINWVKSVTPRPKNIILNHGEPSRIEGLARVLSRTVARGMKIYTPNIRDSIVFVENDI
ncbi:beta-CASP ribonuclease aCPSF1 [Ignicoccus hospitalis]|uniref:Transcription termination factor FttA n=1 Tax=Ignicoccus hospitalis (strain KIN4/I / DSM 18386 / JCM 14125) TaxID=453591 RepID=A8A8E1_IGNH4|nr:beta-CASP ribonuclease aCPSF1 [Ignicoccus hospitalis]ABU81193.1 beta-lactamase domain protein [Ignicoccus hospitalis KIN4/I]HIH90623.1 beta-CASP ribonuclease aCPSF1 [Desulfurococcaceae archaeon]